MNNVTMGDGVREIKFRAWKKSERKMLNWWELCECRNASNDFVLPDALNRIRYEDVMQYTGLKDSKGREIYEGDILEHPNYKNMDVYGKYISSVAWGETGDSDGFYYGKHVTWITVENHNSLADVAEHSTIIGNIYENPELLEGDK